MCEEIAAIDRVVEVTPLAITQLAGKTVDTVDAPLAQTLCERRTGVRLTRSTSIPSSASFMVAAKPANPPPTITTRRFAIDGHLFNQPHAKI